MGIQTRRGRRKRRKRQQAKKRVVKRAKRIPVTEPAGHAWNSFIGKAKDRGVSLANPADAYEEMGLNRGAALAIEIDRLTMINDTRKRGGLDRIKTSNAIEFDAEKNITIVYGLALPAPRKKPKK